jgi:disulfide bond formation protein DsbB
VKSFLTEQGLYMSFMVALTAVLGSLYFSEIMEYPPCTYCWYQRILMYPLVILLGIAAVRRDLRQSIYIMPLAALGMGMSSLHYLTQKTDFFAQGASSCGIVPCVTQYINWFGFITIPFLALTAFTILFIIQFMLWRISVN